MMIGATLFSGGGGVEALLKDRVQFVRAVEYDPAIASVYRTNHGDHIRVADVCDLDYADWPTLDYLHASPVCKNASQAKTDGAESDTDIRTAQATVRCLDATQPQVFTLENVQGYQKFDAYRLICRALDRLGYMWHAEVLNSANFGVPQTRRRLILRAVKDSLLPTLPESEPWVGWYAAIEDLIPTLPASAFAPWQLARLPEEISGAALLMQSRTADQEWGRQYREYDEPFFTIDVNGCKPKAFLMRGANSQQEWGEGVPHALSPAYTVATDSPPRAFIVSNAATEYSDGIREAGEPMLSVTTQTGSRAKAFIMDGVNNSKEFGVTYRADDEPMVTVTATTHSKAAMPRAWLSQGRVVKMTPRALARFQSLPDSFWLPEKTSLACTVIGNAVPSLMIRKIVEQLI